MVIDEEAARAGVDANLLKAIVYTENARGHYLGLEKAMTGVRKLAIENNLEWLRDSRASSQSIMPMNIQPKIWGDFGIRGMNAFDARKNIRAGATLVKRTMDRVGDPTPEKVSHSTTTCQPTRSRRRATT